MKRPCLVAFLAICAAVSAAAERPQLVSEDHAIHTGGVVSAAKALGDTLYLIGNPENPAHYSDAGVGPQAIGTFEDASGQPNWHGWTTVDETVSASSIYWQVSEFLAISGQYSYWCGTEFDGDPGYGNDWDQGIVFTETVADPAVASTVDWSFQLDFDTEPNYDFVYVQYNRAGEWIDVGDSPYDGRGLVALAETVTIDAGEYAGQAGDEIQLRILFESDIAWSDEDGLFESDGACRVDDVAVTIDGELIDFEDFEDQTVARWVPQDQPYVGDFAQLYTNLFDLDPCVQNTSAQVAFVDNGLVVPGTGGTEGITWRYGPGGYVVNSTGGLAGEGYYLENSLVSPVIEWPEGADGARLEFEAYTHEPLDPLSPGIFYSWFVRSVDTGDPADLADAPLEGDFSLYLGGPSYWDQKHDVTRHLVPGRTHVQVVFSVRDLGRIFQFFGDDATPAPYFDNVRLLAHPYEGPAIASRTIDHFQDGFPASGTLDYDDLGSNSVRLDIANNLTNGETGIVPGDSLVFDVRAVRGGASLVEHPRLHVRLRANPLFDPYRMLPDGFTMTSDHFADGWTLISGSVAADSCFRDEFNGPVWVADRWEVDLPDAHFFYPGDELRWFVAARDQVSGDVGTAIMPADTTGLSDFADEARYPRDFTVRALPTMLSDVPGDQPSVLFWNDADEDLDAWRFALANIGYRRGVHYDVFVTRNGEAEDGNGLGARSTVAQLDGYRVLLYASGTRQGSLLGNGEALADASPDVQLLSGWLDLGDKNALFTSANLAESLARSSTGQAFLADYLGAELLGDDLAPLIGSQTVPGATPLDGNGFLTLVDRWLVNGGCPTPTEFDAVAPIGTAVRLAEFTDPGGQGGAYPYAAAIAHELTAVDSKVIYLPYDLTALLNAPGWVPPSGWEAIPARALILDEILDRFGEVWFQVPVGSEAPRARLAAHAYPNPFNPQTVIALTIPRATDVSLKVYDVRGKLVRSLVDGELAAGEHRIAWDGTGGTGRPVASGVYFYETRAAGETSIGKLTLIK